MAQVLLNNDGNKVEKANTEHKSAHPTKHHPRTIIRQGYHKDQIKYNRKH